jgi:hypothetical protein
MRLVMLLAAMGPLAAHGEAQTVRLSAPKESYLLEITRDAGARSGLGDLAIAPMAVGDVELRFWGGYGLAGTYGLILQRRQGTWTALHGDLRSCSDVIPSSTWDTLTAEGIERIKSSLRANCARQGLQGSGHFVTAHALTLDTLPSGSDLTELWERLERGGLTSLPASIPRKWVMMDGHTFVIEVRVATAYRASVIECFERDQTRADRRVQALARQLRERFPQARGLRCY